MVLQSAVAIVLKKYRLKSNLTQEELAHRCNIDRTYISMLERQKRRPTLNVIFSICSNLGIKTSEFIKEIEKIMEEQ